MEAHINHIPYLWKLLSLACKNYMLATMKILHINKSDIKGGGAIAGYRLHQSLLRKSTISTLLVDEINIDANNISLINRRRYVEMISSRLFWYLGLNYINITSTSQITDHSLYTQADILNFHNLHGSYFNYLAIPKLTAKKPAVYTLHDMWGFTGHCAYSFDCQRWKIGCGNCPYLDTYPSIARDNTHIEWKLKQWVHNRSNLTIVTPSQWLANLVQKSLLSRFSIHHIPHGLDINCYRPLEPQICRQALNLPDHKTVILLVAQNLRDPRKGSDLLIEALKYLPSSLTQDLVLLVVGEGGEIFEEITDIQTLSLGYIGGDRLKALAYSAADIFIFPTRADIFGLVLLESMACGTPMVSFDVGGVPELVRPGQTGLLARPEDPKDLAAKIVKLLEDDDLRQRMAKTCRDVAVAEYSIELQADRYIALYRQVIDEFHNRHTKFH
ncbi:Glycosyltransferase Type 1 [Halomicronema hongdechloris C2206]|uniref:Glycosyltransferase Type 1 n=1 Tax=Halomicronema hongdechloris C2206 TaxID=1641165 RepID=A0A1Z3HMG1_9CYAN|nr:glycosyltransferase family 4 protein [Halomicronema hongdechloris]ASC71436.1 Glycosyltransferase Type 1 [Halomicronema hongdechloris C2206]